MSFICTGCGTKADAARKPAKCATCKRSAFREIEGAAKPLAKTKGDALTKAEPVHLVATTINNEPAETKGPNLSRIAGRPPLITLAVYRGGPAAVRQNTRLSTGFRTVDKYLGGGFVRRTNNGLCGDPGCGKSTFAMQMAGAVAASGEEVLYAGAEEQIGPLEERAARLCVGGAEHLHFLISAEIEAVGDYVRSIKPSLVIVDSVSKFSIEDREPGEAHTVGLVGKYICKICPAAGTTSLLILHVNKSGDMAGPKAFEHETDGNFYMSVPEDGAKLRAFYATKNRNGAIEGQCYLAMEGAGLIEPPAGIEDDDE